MNESEWNTCTDPQVMLDWLREQGRLSDRKARLFAVACCRRIWHLLNDERSRYAVELAERSADEQVSYAELDTASGGAEEAYEDSLTDDAPRPDAAAAASYASSPGILETLHFYVILEGASAASPVGSIQERVDQARILRDLLGPLPFRPVMLPPSVRAWNSGCVVTLATAIYDDRLLPSGHLDTARLAILADALEEASCTDAELLAHLRSPGPHVRGCFALDAVLGKG